MRVFLGVKFSVTKNYSFLVKFVGPDAVNFQSYCCLRN